MRVWVSVWQNRTFARLVVMPPRQNLLQRVASFGVLGIRLFAAAICLCAAARAAAAQPGVPPPPLTNPAEAMEFARRNLPPGVNPGDILRDDPTYPSGDVADVYRAVLDMLYYTGSQKPPVVVLWELADPRLVGSCDYGKCLFIPPHKSRIDTLTLQDFRRVTLTRREIRKDFKYRLPLTLLTKRQQEAMSVIAARAPSTSAEVEKMEHPYWLGFTSAYPGAWGMAAVTQVGFNPPRTEALLQVRHHCGSHCQSVEMMFLRKSKGQWGVAERMPELSFDTDLGHEFLRFRGVGAKKPLVEERAAFVADSVRKTRIPRAIRGVVTDALSSAPVVLAKVSLHAGNAPNTPWDQVYSDSAGRYVFENPPVGSAGLMVYCPKSTARASEVVAVAGANVDIGTDTTVNFPIEMNLCLDPGQFGLSRRARTLENPAPALMTRAERATATASSFPSMEEAAIYTTVLNGMHGQTPGETLLVANRTRSFCWGPQCGESYNKRIRSVPEVILTTMENFLTVRDKSLTLRPNFTSESPLISSYATRSDVMLIGDSALRYLQSEGRFFDSAYVASRHGDARGYWETIKLAYPSARQLVAFSPVAFSPRRKQAMVEAMRVDVNGLQVNVFVLNNEEKGWRIVRIF